LNVYRNFGLKTRRMCPHFWARCLMLVTVTYRYWLPVKGWVIKWPVKLYVRFFFHRIQQKTRLHVFWVVAHVFSNTAIVHTFTHTGTITITTLKQEAQLPQRNSASATHMEGAMDPPAHFSDAPTGYISMRLVESETHNKRTSSVPSNKRTLRWIGHSKSFKVILIGAGRNPEWSVVVMCN